MSQNNKCPKCGSVNVYLGMNTIECGYISSCENWTETQSKIVNKTIPSTTKKSFDSQGEFDWSSYSDEDLDSMYPAPDFYYD